MLTVALHRLPATHIRATHFLHQYIGRHDQPPRFALSLPDVERQLPGQLRAVFADIEDAERIDCQRFIDGSSRHTRPPFQRKPPLIDERGLENLIGLRGLVGCLIPHPRQANLRVAGRHRQAQRSRRWSRQLPFHPSPSATLGGREADLKDELMRPRAFHAEQKQGIHLFLGRLRLQVLLRLLWHLSRLRFKHPQPRRLLIEARLGEDASPQRQRHLDHPGAIDHHLQTPADHQVTTFREPRSIASVSVSEGQGRFPHLTSRWALHELLDALLQSQIVLIRHKYFLGLRWRRFPRWVIRDHQRVIRNLHRLRRREQLQQLRHTQIAHCDAWLRCWLISPALRGRKHACQEKSRG